LSVGFSRIEHVNDSRAAATIRLRAAVEALAKAEVEQAVAIAELAEAHEWTWRPPSM
jgi:hypothetical protein